MFSVNNTEQYYYSLNCNKEWNVELDDFIYNNIIDNIAQEFERLIGNIKTVYNFDYGNEFEISVCNFLKIFCL